MRFLQLVGALTPITSLASAGIIGRQSSAQVAKLGGWVETMAVRSNGDLLLNRLDTPELWTVTASDKKASKLLSFTGAKGLTGIAEISPDIFVVISGDFDTKSFALGSGSYAAYKVDLTSATPTSTLIKKIPEISFGIGVAPFNNDTVFIADAGNGALYQLTVSTGAYSVALADPKMKAPSNAMIDEGIHGLKYHNGFVYFTNTFGNTFNKVAVDPTTGKVTSTVTLINDSLQGPEDFTVTANGTAYVATLTAGAVFKVTPDGKATKFADATQCSTAAFGRGASDKNVIYIATSQGNVLSAAVS